MILGTANLSAQIRGTVVDADDGFPIPYASIFMPQLKQAMTTDGMGNFQLPSNVGKSINVSSVGYVKQTVDIKSAGDSIVVRLKAQAYSLSGVTVKSHRKRYRRKDNPAVELMRRVIEKKKETDLHKRDFLQLVKYQKIVMSQNDIDTLKHKRKPWYNNHVEASPVDSSKLILPLTVDEQITRELYRRSPKRDVIVLEAQRSSGVNKIFQTGEMVNTMLKEVFQDVNINDNYVRLLQYPFPSPIGKTAISFYHYFIQDTIRYEGDSCYHVLFYPANQQDFGFKGQLYITKDSDLHVKYCQMEIPKKSDVNFVDRMQITQSFTKLKDGTWVLSHNDMAAQMKLAAFLPKMLVVRNTRIGEYSFDSIPPKLLSGRAPRKEAPSARIRSQEYWNQERPMPLSKGEEGMDYFVYRLTKSKNFGWAQLVLKALVENFVETSKPGNPSRFDVGPVNTLISHNFIDGYRLRLNGRTMAALNPHFFWKGFAAYGTSSHKWYYGSELTWSLNKKENSPFEFPTRTLTFETTYDLTAPSDKYLTNNKDNVFESFRTSSVRQMYFLNSQKLEFKYETDWGARFTTALKTESNRTAGDLHFIHVNDGSEVYKIRTTEMSFSFNLTPGQTYINTKQRRWPVNFDIPEFEITHTVGMKNVLGSDYNSNMTEMRLYKRQWLGSWGYINMHLVGRAQWNKVPFPLLCMPPVTLTYFTDINDETFNLMKNMEFLNDRYVFWSAVWDLNGKIFNRIPLLKKLKWREIIGIKGMWGHLTDKNNPALDPNDPMLFQLPEDTHVMTNQPYWEAMAGIHNIFKFFGVEYVRRLTYNNYNNIDKWGIRFNFMMTF